MFRVQKISLSRRLGFQSMNVVRYILACFLSAALTGFLIACEATETQSLSDMHVPDLIFVRYASDGSDIYGLRLSDMTVVQMTDTEAAEEFPVWSKDGSQFAYLSMLGDQVEIKARTALSDEDVVLLVGAAEPVSWSGDSKFIVVTKELGESRGLFMVSTRTGDETIIPTGANGDAYATWSPKSDVIAFESTRDGNPEIYTADIDGRGVARLTDNNVLDEWPQWSNSGEHIAYASGVEGDKDLWIMRSDGTEKRQLTKNLLFGDSYPSWSPDDSKLVITVLAGDKDTNLMVVDVESGVTELLLEGAAASWSPRRAEEFVQ